ncbi:hypothetical protein GTQ43_03650 [Nostoc sp. KVJ3]|uniref:hypothetical protein n=1 Tax=Nostoc sp. KVJ3 TaxID=457945 RepID=UPI002238FB4B|nr:hypothetical protein [Nostoc sp. KVJ3]MCW5312976.1 hypothetical protein [Nostoc sp. KVJ3]
MKRVFILGFSLVILGSNQLSAVADNRQPTNTEINQLRQELREEIPKLRTYKKTGPENWSDYRKTSEIQTQEDFVRTWSRIAPTVAPFLGEWQGQEAWLMIYPSRVKNQVCIIFMPGDTEDVKFAVSSVSNKQIRFQLSGKPNVIIKEQEFLGLIDVLPEDNRAKLWLHTYPKLLKHPSSQIYKRNTAKILSQFNAAGCTTSKP